MYSLSSILFQSYVLYLVLHSVKEEKLFSLARDIYLFVSPQTDVKRPSNLFNALWAFQAKVWILFKKVINIDFSSASAPLPLPLRCTNHRPILNSFSSMS